jgi:hypothetical protein
LAPGSSYPRFRAIDGRHPYKASVPDGYVAYPARRLRGARVVWFHFALAREMGLIPDDHPDRMNARLARAILDAFAIRIVNEYDVARGRAVPARERLGHTYMATRYLQLQHPDRRGRTSGDGRSVWNGTVRHRGITWDVTSCGTGVTRLSPAAALATEPLATGNDSTDYGCGTATVEEGLGTALTSETFHRAGIATERTLAVLELADGFAINVRAGRNLLRPSHFFVHLKQARLGPLRAAVDAFLDRQEANGDAPRLSGPARYRSFAEHAARAFARAAATFESEYVFCWLDWDGDNVLADGGIVDYGSVRQFGLYHREYRFDDGPRWSTTIPEQRRKARHIVQNFAQIRDWLCTGRRRPLSSFAHDPILTSFDRTFAETRRLLLLRSVGFAPGLERRLAPAVAAELDEFRRVHAWFERARSARGPIRVEDGITWNAVYSTRDLLRELPGRLLEQGPLAADDVLEIALSSYASPGDRKPTAHRRRMAARFQARYLDLIAAAARVTRRSVPRVLSEVAGRAAAVNRRDRITGDAAIYATQHLVRRRRALGPDGLYRVIDAFVRRQSAVTENGAPRLGGGRDVRRTFDAILGLMAEMRHGI